MKKKEFALGILCGAMLFDGATAVAAGITDEPTWQNIYVDGEQMSMTAYNIAGNNYAKLRDIGKEVGFNCNLTAFTGVSPRRAAEKAVTNWVNSPGHFQTMIGTDYDSLGVGVTIDHGRVFCYMMVGHPNAYNPYGP